MYKEISLYSYRIMYWYVSFQTYNEVGKKILNHGRSEFCVVTHTYTIIYMMLCINKSHLQITRNIPTRVMKIVS